MTTGLWMLGALALTLILTGLPAWVALLGVALVFATGGVVAGAFPLALLTAIPSRLLGLMENDLLQALPLYVLMGALLNHLPLARALFRTGSRGLDATGAGAPLAGLGLGVLLAPMNGSVGASVATLARTVLPRLREAGLSTEHSAALVCVTSTLGVVVPPSLVLILLSDTMMRAHTEAVNATGAAVRIINTQDLFVGALAPAAALLALYIAIAWQTSRRASRQVMPALPSGREHITAIVTGLLVLALLSAVTLGYLYAVEAAAAGGVALLLYGILSRALVRKVLDEVLRDTMAVSGALFALLVGATVFTSVLRDFGTDRWIAGALEQLPGGAPVTLAVALGCLALCALVLDAFEIIFVIIPVLMPPVLMKVGDATWVAVLALMILQVSFMAPPFGYAVLMVRNAARETIPLRGLARSLAPYLLAQIIVLAAILAWPALVWHRDTSGAPPGGSTLPSVDEQRRMLEQQLNQNSDDTPSSGAAGSDAPRR